MSIRTLIAPARYVQGKGALSLLGEHLARLGSRPLVIADDMVWQLVGRTVTESIESAGLAVVRETYSGYTTARVIESIVAKGAQHRADVMVGIGGGSAIDAVKAAGHLSGIRWASVPTVASTDAPCSALSVVYREDGAFDEYRFLPRNPDLVLVDSQLIANAPTRFLIAGVGDALATWPEARAVAAAGGRTMAGGLPTASGTALARLSWEILHENAIQAIEAVRVNAVTPAVEKVIEANTLLSGLGFESGGLAAAHAIHDGLTAVPHTHGLTHGEKVNLGTVTQLVLEGRPSAEIRDFIEFTTRVGLPTTLTEAGLGDADIDVLNTVAKAATAEGETIHSMSFEVTPGDLVDALRSVEGLSRLTRKAAGLPAPEPLGTKR
jgi:glycerol dehydrogenase